MSGLTRLGQVARRWWRWLTSMRTALILLILLALASIPGSLLPQRPVSQSVVAQYFAGNPDLAPLFDRLGLFDVFSSPWFSAIYLLLFTSLIGCLVPRTWGHVRTIRSEPVATPRRLSRLPRHDTIESELSDEALLDIAEAELRTAKYRVARRDGTLSAEKGFAKETGNVVFHLALIGILISLAVGKLWGYEGSILVQEGQGFCNTFQQYDYYSAGALVDGSDLTPLCVDLEAFQARYEANLTPASFTGDVTYNRAPGAAEQQIRVGVNDPLRVDGARLYITGRGFAPVFTLTLPDGTQLADIATPFLPTDSSTMASEGVLKLPDLGADRPELAIAGFFVPTALDLGDGVLTSADPRPLDPAVSIIVYEGSTGLDSGIPQNVFTLDQLRIDRGQLTRIGSANLRPGETLGLPDGTTITFTGFREFAAMQLNHDPGQVGVLVTSITMLGGLMVTLLIRRRRVFVRPNGAAASAGAGQRILEVGGLAHGSSTDPSEFEQLVSRIRTAVAEASSRASAPGKEPDA